MKMIKMTMMFILIRIMMTIISTVMLSMNKYIVKIEEDQYNISIDPSLENFSLDILSRYPFYSSSILIRLRKLLDVVQKIFCILEAFI